MTNAPFLRFAVLGPVRAWRNGEPSPEELALGGPQQRALLAALLLRSGRAVPIDALVAAVWGRSPRRGRSERYAPMCPGCAGFWRTTGPGQRSCGRPATATGWTSPTARWT
ncbi:hypothetical protein GCM10009678_36970 [Actinomadura kijaniata]|uniref:hypothetical protein n=1 Tax=Actinomadura kijaniata TaxID=46161 RepID=UPI001C71B1B5|nr:hypothetical protein [Actinomadura namibiensis]